ncbi:MAG: hypothetical protein GX763_01205 [Clostridiaceae bacterium]|nr:hypothetical protein [Clostridiaceae bacterium]
MVRFCRKYGFKGFQDMKIFLAKGTSDPYVQMWHINFEDGFPL